jgi:hypothetical protein
LFFVTIPKASRLKALPPGITNINYVLRDIFLTLPPFFVKEIKKKPRKHTPLTLTVSREIITSFVHLVRNNAPLLCSEIRFYISSGVV